LESSNWDETWTRDLHLHLVTNSTHGKEFEVQTKNFLDLDSKAQIEGVVTALGAHAAPSSAPVPAAPIPANDQGSQGNSAVEGSRDEEVLQARPSVPGIQLGVDTVEAEGLPAAPCSPKDSLATELSLEAVPPRFPSMTSMPRLRTLRRGLPFQPHG
jgi:hypothetical protein